MPRYSSMSARGNSELLVSQGREAEDEAAAGVERMDRCDVRSVGDVGDEGVGFGFREGERSRR